MPDAQTVLAAVLLAVVPSLIYLAILNAIDRYEKEPWTILLACLGRRGRSSRPRSSLAILVLAGPRRPRCRRRSRPARSPTRSSASWRASSWACCCIVLVHSVRDEFDDVLDGVIYGAAIGAGFGAAESFLYVAGRHGRRWSPGPWPSS